MTNKDAESAKEISKLIDTLSVKVLEDLEAGEYETDVEALMDAIETYTSLPNQDVKSIKKWQERVFKITQILETQYTKVQEELKDLVHNNPKLSAYGKAASMTREEE